MVEAQPPEPLPSFCLVSPGGIHLSDRRRRVAEGRTFADPRVAAEIGRGRARLAETEPGWLNGAGGARARHGEGRTATVRGSSPPW